MGIPDGHHYDWFFITGSTFPFVPEWLMPFAVFFAVYGMCALIYLINFVVRKIISNRQNKKLAVQTKALETSEKTGEAESTANAKDAGKE